MHVNKNSILRVKSRVISPAPLFPPSILTLRQSATPSQLGHLRLSLQLWLPLISPHRRQE
ncbi:hypothetical protein BT69DRAFT_1276532 [Atractiella rhizophila]|nr:hypothetical protein BT69DRAFT_1283879 [Atractiella rhizophila]KAH8929262.1 hypothetical protein BT69DRAFT_1276532 [Atractiella rhizophila]